MGKWRARPCVGGCDQCIYGEMESQSGGRKAILPAALPIAHLAWGLAATKVGQAAFPPPPAPARPGTLGLALRWRHGSATVLVPWAPTPMGTPSQRPATSKPPPSQQPAKVAIVGTCSEQITYGRQSSPAGANRPSNLGQGVGNGRSRRKAFWTGSTTPQSDSAKIGPPCSPNSATLPEFEMLSRADGAGPGDPSALG